MVGRVCDHDSVVRPHCDAAGPSESSGLAPPTPYLEQLTAFLQVLAARARSARSETWK